MQDIGIRGDLHDVVGTREVQVVAELVERRVVRGCELLVDADGCCALALVEVIDEEVDLAARGRLPHESPQTVLERRERMRHMEGQFKEALVDGLQFD